MMIGFVYSIVVIVFDVSGLLVWFMWISVCSMCDKWLLVFMGEVFFFLKFLKLYE